MGLFKKIRDGIIDNFSSNRPYYSNEGYKQVYRPNSSSARKNGYAPEHRYNYEQKYGNIPEGHVVHHINGNKRDNRASNLQAMPKKQHDRYHNFPWVDHD